VAEDILVRVAVIPLEALDSGEQRCKVKHGDSI
jgi:hypothetical protein